MDRGVPKERFRCIIFYLSFQLRTNTYKTEVLLYQNFILIIIITTIKITIIIIMSFNKV